MSGSINKVILIGNVGKDPEVRSMNNGGQVCNLTVATSESWKDKTSGERKEKSEWHRVTIFNEHLLKFAQDYIRKGAKVYVEGTLETRKWTDAQGVEKYTTEVVLKQYRGELAILDKRGSDAAPVPAPQQAPAYSPPPQAQAPRPAPSYNQAPPAYLDNNENTAVIDPSTGSRPACTLDRAGH